MNAPVDIRMALGTDIIGMVLVIVMIIGNIWRLRLKNRESRLLIVMLATCFSCCLSDLLAFATDGGTRLFSSEAVFFTNTWLYASNFLCAVAWFEFLKERFNAELTRSQSICIWICMIVLPLMLVVNIFYPFVFDVGADNRYERLFGYWIYIAFNYGIILNSLVLYYTNYRKDGNIRFFPIWLYVIPLVTATVVQSIWYGVSLMAPSFAVAIVGAFSSLQNERMFRDDLTGLFNRSFLDYVLFLYSQKGRHASGIMVSLVGFEQINEQLGHNVGDEALCRTAYILHESVGHWGSILRYSGDEFIVMIDSQYDNSIANCIEKLKMNFDKFNRTGYAPYRLTAAIGFKKYDGEREDVNLFLNGLAASVKQSRLLLKGE